jgi:hypothetical protein
METTNSTKNGLLLSIIEATLESGSPAASQFTIARISRYIHRAAYSAADGRLIRQYTPAATYVSHMSRIVALF